MKALLRTAPEVVLKHVERGDDGMRRLQPMDANVQRPVGLLDLVLCWDSESVDARLVRSRTLANV